MRELGGGLGEYLVTGEVRKTLEYIWRFPYIPITSSCLTGFKQCQ